MKSMLLAGSAFALMTAGAAQAQNAFALDSLTGFEQMEYDAPVKSDFTAGATAAVPLLASSIGQQRQLATFTPTATVVKSFQGISQYDVASYARNFIPPDTMGAVGSTQFVQFANGGFAVFGKDGTVQKATSDVAFWAAAGQTGANGDSRVLFDKAAGRWVALSFGASVSDIQIAVSKTADATGAWQSTKFTGYSGPGGTANSVADYPTLAIDTNAVYIGTNNFGSTDANSPEYFRGTTMNVIPLSSLVNAVAPTTVGIKSFNNPYDPVNGGIPSAYVGYAMQGVNSTQAGTTGKVVSESLYYYTDIAYDIKNVGTAGATLANGTYLNNSAFTDPTGPARQPNVVPDANPNASFANNDRVIDSLDARIGSNVYEANGRIYSVQTVSDDNTDTSKVRWTVVDAATNTVLADGDIGDGVHDFFEGSLTVNDKGQVVIGYNRSGSNPADGRVSFFAQVFSTDASGHLTARGAAQLLQVSAVDDYHNGSVDGQVAAGRQRWGDYSQVTLDPTDPSKFWVIGEFAREYNDAAGGHPGGTGGSRWSTWIAEINAGNTVPEPASWAMMIAGFGLIGTMTRRQRRTVVAA